MNQVFLEAIRDDPADEVSRLVYADWLEDHGDFDRAEFIRVQCELARGTRDRGHTLELLRRLRALILEHRAAWLGPLLTLAPDAIFERGFVDQIRISASLFLEHADTIFATHPIRHVRLERAHRIWGDLLECPHLAVLDTLELQGEPLRDDGLMLMARCLHLGHLRTLDLSSTGCSAVGVSSLIAGGEVAGLEALTLSYNALGNAAVEALVRPPGLPGLRRLDLSHANLPESSARILAAAPMLRELQFLSLWGNRMNQAGVELLLESEAFPNLEMLDVRGCTLGERPSRLLRQRFGAKILI